jgi:dipeptidase
MCDTLVATGKATIDGSVILAKNSDREADEIQILSYYPEKAYKEGEECKCTYISIPQVKQTYQILISRPFWMWGCEMGANEYGLAIGNEAVFTKEPVEKNGLLGMDLIRICLERCKTAYDALMLTTELIEKYGQGGNAGYRHSLFYHNSFIFADPFEAYVLETANKHWVAIKVDGVRSISNGLTIEENFDFSSKGIEDYARRKGYLKKGKDFNFKKAFSDRFYTYFSKCKNRQNRSTYLLNTYKGSIDPEIMMEFLRDHGDNNINPSRSDMGSICMHASLFPTRPSQSVSSFVAQLRKNLPTIWATGSSAPCTSIFLPFYLKENENLDFSYFPSLESEKYDEKSYWWLHEKLHRLAIFKYDYFKKQIATEIKELELQLIEKDNKLYSQKSEFKDFIQLSKESVKQSIEKYKIWLDKISSAKESKIDPFFSIYWKKLNKLNKIR